VRYVLFACAPADNDDFDPEGSCQLRLRPAADATTVRVERDEVLLSDGPFTRSEWYVAGLDIVEAADLDEAIALAARHPVALGGGAVEVRPVWESA